MVSEIFLSYISRSSVLTGCLSWKLLNLKAYHIFSYIFPTLTIIGFFIHSLLDLIHSKKKEQDQSDIVQGKNKPFPLRIKYVSFLWIHLTSWHSCNRKVGKDHIQWREIWLNMERLGTDYTFLSFMSLFNVNKTRFK